MPPSDLPELPWTEAASRDFLDRGAVDTPHREEIRDAILDLVPAREDVVWARAGHALFGGCQY